ncbi:NDR1/HIN1-like protein 1 [Typha latifolia]|uniref:NDR1/HIN1-like protein 1 n=1 Tax=Typha latifolia TaxID=4733 RepID=UPI003C2E520C
MAEEEATTSYHSPPPKIHGGVSKVASRRSPVRVFIIALLALLILASVVALVLYLVYRPSRPRFSVTTAAIYSITNTSSSPAAAAVSATMQFTLLIRNPNSRSSVRYDRLSAHVAYRGEAITPPMPLPPLVLESGMAVSVSPVLGGAAVPVSANVAAGLGTDKAYGVVALRLVVVGRGKYKSGPFHSRWNSMYVRCDMLVGVRKGVTGQVPLLGNPDCHVDI